MFGISSKTALVLTLLMVSPLAAAPVVRGPLGEKADAYLSRLEALGFSGALLVAKDGQVVLEKGYGLADQAKKQPFTEDTQFDIGSITKQFTAAAILKLEMQGKLSVNDPVSKYFPVVPEDKRGITLHHLLTHSAGLEDGFGGDYEEAPRDQVVKQALESKLLWAPGTKYRYSNAGYSLLGAVVEIVSGRPYEEFLRENLWQPAGMTRTGYRLQEKGTVARGYRAGEDWGTPLEKAWAPEGPWWHLRANGGVLSTVGDLYRWHRALEGDLILSAAAKAKAFAPQMPEDEEGSSHYGYGWAIFKTPRNTKLIAHNGGNGVFAADFRRYVDENVVLITGSNQSDFSSIQALGQVARLVFGMEFTEPPAVARVDAAALKKLAGTYALPSGGKLVVSPAADNPAGYPRLRVTAEGSDAFVALNGGNPENRAVHAEREKKLLAALEQGRRGSYTAQAELYGVPVRQAEEETKSIWQGLEGSLGAFQGFEVLGTAGGQERATTYVRASFKTGSRILHFGWGGSQIGTVRVLEAMPGGMFLPESSTGLVSFDLNSRSAMRIGFETGEGGAVNGLVVRTPAGDVKAKRVG